MTAVTEPEVQDATLTIRPLQPTIGAEISGVDLRSPLSDAERDQIKAAILGGTTTRSWRTPVVRTHRETGKKILFVNFTEHPWIVGLDRDESRELLSIVHDQYRKPELQVRFSWRPVRGWPCLPAFRSGGPPDRKGCVPRGHRDTRPVPVGHGAATGMSR